MTEKPLSITTQTAISTQAASNSTVSAVPVNDAQPFVESADEEPYTIKCICDYDDDDGNTIYCEKCNTWQHTECYHPGKIEEASKDDFDHACIDCEPRFLNRHTASERQRENREKKILNDNGDKKPKRPISKSHKKKTKPAEVNGVLDHDKHRNNSPQEQHPQTKKTKGHRTNPSISSHAKRSPPFNPRPSHAHPPSPAHTPPDLPINFQVHGGGYSDKFTHIYDHSPPPSSTNTDASLEVTNSMSSWLQDPAKLQDDAGAKKEDVFYYSKVPLERIPTRELKTVEKQNTINQTNYRWKYLVSPDAISSGAFIAELNGLVGFQRDYPNDDPIRWQEAPHPQPFVFFLPRLPLYIDTREEGSICRFVRRSCRANTTLETVVASRGSEYHFWLISERQIAAGEQLTLPWDFRFAKQASSRYLHLLNLGDEEGARRANAEATDDDYETLSQVLQLVLADHGGCACDLGDDCAFARFYRTYYGRSQPPLNMVKVKKGRKVKQSHVSPTSTGPLSNIRAASEGHGDQHDEDDSRSISGSSRSKPQSRDLTPSHGVPETNGTLPAQSDREKRKIANYVELIQKQSEQGQPPRKKKRASDGSNINVPNNASAPQATTKVRQKSVARTQAPQPSINGQRVRYVDASTSRRQSGSPLSAVSPTAPVQFPPNIQQDAQVTRSRQASLKPKPIYVDAAVQTDEDEKDWWARPQTKHRRKFVSLPKRLLQNRQNIRLRQREQKARQQSMSSGFNGRPSPTLPMDLDHPMTDGGNGEVFPSESRHRDASAVSLTPSHDTGPFGDVTMTDLPAVNIGNQIKPPPPPWPNHITAGSVHIPPSPTQRSPDLRLQLPSSPTFPNLTGPGSLPTSATPPSATGFLAQSPSVSNFTAPVLNGFTQHVNPIKVTKKLSLSDYKANRMKKSDGMNKSVPGTSPTMTHPTLKPSLSTIEEAKARGVLDGSAIVDTPSAEKVENPLGEGAAAIAKE